MTPEPAPVRLDLAARREGGVTVVALTGDLDGRTSPRLQAQLMPLIPDGGKVLLDMSEVAYMSSAGLRVLLLLYRHAHRVQTRLAVVGLSQELKDVMSATGFLNFFLLSDDMATGLEALQR